MSTERINLLHTVLNLGFAGLERIVTELTLRIDKTRFNVEVCCFNKLGPFAELLQEAGIKVWLLEKNPRHFDPRDPLKLVKYFRQHHIHVINTHSGTFFEATAAARLARVPVVVYTDHGRPNIEPPLRTLEDAVTTRFADRVIAVSEELRDNMFRKLKVQKHKMQIILNGVNMETFSPRPKSETLLRELDISPEARVVGTVGRLETIKDQATLIEGFAQLHRALPESVLVLVGGGSLQTELEEQVRSLNLTDSVRFAGKRADIPDFLNLFDLFVLSSVSEGTSVSLLEAMASGLPAVVTNVGGNPAIVDDNVNGILFKVGDADGLAAALQSLLTDDTRRSAFARAAREKVGREYSLDKMVAEYERLFLQLLHRKGKFLQWAE
ncbi:MAG: glycosyltransferase [Candidatus Zixiibacteriota bacterium]